MKYIVIAAAAAAAALMAGSAVAGPIVTATWTGFVSGGTDDAGLFGDAGLDLTNVAFTATYVINPTRGYHESASDYFYGEGGLAIDGGLSPTLSVQFTINGHTYSIDGDFAGVIYASLNDDGYPTELQTSGASITDTFLMAVSNDVADYADHGYGNPLFANFDEDVSGSYSDDYYNNFQYLDGNTGIQDYLTLSNQHLTITTAPAPEPEPASWAMMLGGFGLVGGALRSRRRMAVSFG